ncbi:MAG: alkaline phosphatase family protein [Aliifodinibius sp.]|nr:alkaline phosphatase family protein [Fodinibius sp.]NIV12572.1 alkaline phosphatase family protein [Fodinibius sp.]NIY26268.1 alkaline phosphatase family protein [Fodinibius sp.]
MKSMKAICSTFLMLLMFVSTGWAQETPDPKSAADNPKLVVGIVVDQLRYDYIPLYWDKFEDNGFKRLVEQGFSFNNNHFNYFPTYTGPGHASVYTGATPSVNGIVGNAWYDRNIDRSMYVVSDSTVSPIGTDSDAGKMSPRNLLSTTVTDELKSASPESKVIAVSIKDRGAVLPAGHLGDAAYWYEGETGNFVSSSWYVSELPEWLRDFNDRELAKDFASRTWETLLPMDQYTESSADNRPYEGTFENEDAPVFPHNLEANRGDEYGIISSTPFGNTLIAELAKSAIEGEDLGSGDVTDFLSVSFSSTDYVGHMYGPHSVELQDTYLRLDRNIAGLLDYLDQQVGKGNYLVMLTSDHGVVDVPQELINKNLPGGYFNSDKAVDELEEFLKTEFGNEDWIEDYTNQQVYLDRNLVDENGLSLKVVQQKAADFLLQFEGVKSTNTAYNYQYERYSSGQEAMYQRGFLYDRSGDVFIQLKSGWLDSDYPTGTSHGSPYNYDTHVPLLFYGWNVPEGETSRKTAIPQIAPTISNMLNIPLPSGSEANILQFEE